MQIGGMRVIFNKSFDKQFEKLNTKIQKKFIERLSILVECPNSRVLRVHKLQGKYTGRLSMDVTGDVRAIFRYDGEVLIVFLLIGTHSQLY